MRISRTIRDVLAADLIAFTMFFRLYFYIGENGRVIDWATFYQSMKSILIGNLWMMNAVPNLPYVAEHFAPILYLLAPIAYLPQQWAWLTMWLLIITLLIVFEERALGTRLMLVTLPQAVLYGVPEVYYLAALAPFSFILLLQGDYVWGWLAFALAASSVELVPSALFTAMYITYIIYARLRRIKVPGVIHTAEAVALAVAAVQYATLLVLRHLSGYSDVQPIHNIVGLLSPDIDLRQFALAYATTLPVMYIEPLAAALYFTYTAPLLLTGPVYYQVLSYYLVPFATAALVMARIITGRKIRQLTAVLFNIAFIVMLATAPFGTSLQHYAPAVAGIVEAYAIHILHTPYSSFYICGNYPPSFINCTVPYRPINYTIPNPWASVANAPVIVVNPQPINQSEYLVTVGNASTVVDINQAAAWWASTAAQYMYNATLATLAATSIILIILDERKEKKWV